MAVYYPDYNSFHRSQRAALDKTSSYEAVMKRMGDAQAAQKMAETTVNPNQITTLNGQQDLTTFSGAPLLRLGA